MYVVCQYVRARRVIELRRSGPHLGVRVTGEATAWRQAWRVARGRIALHGTAVPAHAPTRRATAQAGHDIDKTKKRRVVRVAVHAVQYSGKCVRNDVEHLDNL